GAHASSALMPANDRSPSERTSIPRGQNRRHQRSRVGRADRQGVGELWPARHPGQQCRDLGQLRRRPRQLEGVAADHRGQPDQRLFRHASKSAVRIYSKAAAVRYGPLGVRVNTVHPGYMPPMLNATNAGERADKIALTPVGRIGKPIEVAYGVLFLASDEASFVTGAELVIDGGFIAQ